MQVARKLYVPVATALLVLLGGLWLGGTESIDPLTAAQNKRLQFQTGGDSTNVASGELSPAEATLADAVLEKNRNPGDSTTHLLYVGNSQTLAIMDRQAGDLTAPQWLQVFLSRRAAKGKAPAPEVVLGSLPNMTMTEVLIKLIAAGEQSPRRVDVLLFATVLEEFRGLGVREEVVRLLDDPKVEGGLSALLTANPDLKSARTAVEPFAGGAGRAAGAENGERKKDASYAQSVELRLQSAADSLPLFGRRTDIQTQVFLNYYGWRNRLLNINTATSRPVPETSYRATLELLEMTLRYAREKNIGVVIYLAPIRPIQPNPNLTADVERFRRDVPSLCRRYGATCLDYVGLVPEEMWTNYGEDEAGSGGQRDYAHFTGRAHKLVATQLMNDLDAHIEQWSRQEVVSQR
jgi:hypothetical protein